MAEATVTEKAVLTCAMESIEVRYELCEQILHETVDRCNLLEFSICALDEICEMDEKELQKHMQFLKDVLVDVRTQLRGLL